MMLEDICGQACYLRRDVLVILFGTALEAHAVLQDRVLVHGRIQLHHVFAKQKSR